MVRDFYEISTFKIIVKLFVVELLAIQESSDVKKQPARSQPEMTDDYRGKYLQR